LTTAIPGGTGTFTGFGNPAISNGSVAFFATGTNQQGIYTNLTGSLTKVIAQNDILGGETVSSLSFAPTGLSGNQIAFSATFASGNRAMYVATVPVPEPAGVLAVCAVAAAAVSIRRATRP
jgi:hypothetical protein